MFLRAKLKRLCDHSILFNPAFFIPHTSTHLCVSRRSFPNSPRACYSFTHLDFRILLKLGLVVKLSKNCRL